MRLRKSHFKKIITVISVFLGVSILICAANLLIIPYISDKNREYDAKLVEVDNYGGFPLLEKNFTQLTENITTLKNNYNALESEISTANTQKATIEALYNEAEINNQMLKASSSDEYRKLNDKYESLQSKYKDLLDQYNKLKEES